MRDLLSLGFQKSSLIRRATYIMLNWGNTVSWKQRKVFSCLCSIIICISAAFSWVDAELSVVWQQIWTINLSVDLLYVLRRSNNFLSILSFFTLLFHLLTSASIAYFSGAENVGARCTVAATTVGSGKWHMKMCVLVYVNVYLTSC